MSDGLTKHRDASTTSRALAGEVGVATPLLDCLIDLYRRALPMIGERDVAAIIELFESSPPQRN